MNPNDYDQAFQMISLAGSAKSHAMMAIANAREGQFDEAREELAQADEDFKACHASQTQMITQEARGNRVEVNIILVHAQDHLTGAMLMRDIADEFINLYQELRSLRG